jgi:hypothetical protein
MHQQIFQTCKGAGRIGLTMSYFDAKAKKAFRTIWREIRNSVTKETQTQLP